MKAFERRAEEFSTEASKLATTRATRMEELKEWEAKLAERKTASRKSTLMPEHGLSSSACADEAPPLENLLCGVRLGSGISFLYGPPTNSHCCMYMSNFSVSFSSRQTKKKNVFSLFFFLESLT